jgi:flagellar biosynthesis chaperone FliJ
MQQDGQNTQPPNTVNVDTSPTHPQEDAQRAEDRNTLNERSLVEVNYKVGRRKAQKSDEFVTKFKLK